MANRTLPQLVSRGSQQTSDFFPSVRVRVHSRPCTPRRQRSDVSLIISSYSGSARETEANNEGISSLLQTDNLKRADSAYPRAPGRTCPVDYRYSPAVFDRTPDLCADTLYVVGGLYGNTEALGAVQLLTERDPTARFVFNGDFHWFDADPELFAHVDQLVGDRGLRGNVESELARYDVQDPENVGCGCSYPPNVDDAVVERSNRIHARLATVTTAEQRARLGGLPMHLTAQVGRRNIAIVHGDAESLAGWGFGIDMLDEPSHEGTLLDWFTESKVDAFICTHTCLPAWRSFDFGKHRGVVMNNGAAGMPNVKGERFGIVIRVASSASCAPPVAPLFTHRLHGLEYQAIPLHYDYEAWWETFQGLWPPGSDAYESYAQRILHGTELDLGLAGK
ncbi:hypothetical protein CYMTET_24040 [Cymbomonas tetramitiformis]|uniref:Calcineurin-like phosphoesterase domain-containing protein n=1 Tax=Cymbomonas tetramitiformis TaxID=36881 RepID=A0AAE0FX61_9CHLO|nr:hypothetical protein CYMTET_24040 [Cymbomonas tetramitiformis]